MEKDIIINGVEYFTVEDAAERLCKSKDCVLKNAKAGCYDYIMSPIPGENRVRRVLVNAGQIRSLRREEVANIRELKKRNNRRGLMPEEERLLLCRGRTMTMIELNKIYNEDCLEGMKSLDDCSVDLTVTSPPYNVDLGNNKYNKNPYNLYNDNREHHDYIEWLRKIFTLTYEKLKSGGRVCINIGDGKNGAVPTHSDVIQMMCEIGYIPMTVIIWNKNTVSGRTAWGSFNSPSCPSFPTPFEYILVFAKDNKKLQWKGETDLTKEEFIDWSLSLWTFAPETRQKKIGHPAMFPEELPKRLIKMFSWKGALVVDPFMGSGTTAIACINTGRNFIGFEIDKDYYSMAQKRLDSVKNQIRFA